MKCPNSLGLLGTKRRCGISLCVYIISDFIILCMYWSRIGDALKNPILAIIESLDPKYEQTEARNVPQYSNSSVQNINSSTPVYWDEDDRPGVGRMTYHFAATLLYLAYMSVNILILSTTIIKLHYRIENFSTATKENRFLRIFIFDVKSRLARWYFITVILLHMIICMDDMLISHSVGFKLPFNDLCLEIIRQLTILMWKAVGHVIHSLFFIFFLLISGIIIISIKMTVILVCLDDFYGGPFLSNPNLRRQSSDGARTQANSNRRAGSSDEVGTRRETTSIIISVTRHSSSKSNDLPPKYEDETLPPTYDEALELASLTNNEIRSD